MFLQLKNRISLAVLMALFTSLYTPLICANTQTSQEAPPVYNPYNTLMSLHMPSLAQKSTEEDKEEKKIAAENEELKKNIFKISGLKIPPVRQVEKMRIGYNLFAHYYASNPTNNANVINTNTLNDLELLCGYTGNLDKHVFLHLDQASTVAGKIQLQKMLLEPLSNIDQLNNRQTVIKTLVTNEALLNELTAELKKIGAAEHEFFWFWKTIDNVLNQQLDALYYPNFLGMGALNKFPTILQWQRFMNAVLMPGMMIVSTLGLTGLTFATRNPGLGISALYGAFVSSIIISVTLLQQNMVNTAHGKMNGVAALSNASAQLASIIENHSTLKNLFPIHNILKNVANPSTDDSKYLMELLTEETFKGDPTFFSYQGRALVAFKIMTSIKDTFLRSLVTIGHLDAYVSIAHLYKKYAQHPRAKFCFPEFVKSEKPLVTINNFWLPSLNPEKVVTNSMELGQMGKARSMIVTGPNAGGKSTALKGITLAILLAQSFGIAPAHAMILTPFSKINTYMNITDTAGSASLFQAEMRRTNNLIQTLKNLSPTEFAFIIMDEIFTGTNAEEGEAGAYGVAKKLAGFDNAVCIFATHFKALTKLEQVTNGLIENRKVCVIKNTDGSFIFPYKLEAGITNQAIALDLLQQEGFDADILNAAHEIMNKSHTVAPVA